MKGCEATGCRKEAKQHSRAKEKAKTSSSNLNLFHLRWFYTSLYWPCFRKEGFSILEVNATESRDDLPFRTVWPLTLFTSKDSARIKDKEAPNEWRFQWIPNPDSFDDLGTLPRIRQERGIATSLLSSDWWVSSIRQRFNERIRRSLKECAASKIQSLSS